MVLVITPPPPARPRPIRNPIPPPKNKNALSPPRQLALQRALLEQLSASRAELREERERGQHYHHHNHHHQEEVTMGRSGRDSYSRIT